MSEQPDPRAKNRLHQPLAAMTAEAVTEELSRLDNVLKIDRYIDRPGHIALETGVFAVPIAFIDSVTDQWTSLLTEQEAPLARTAAFTGSRLAMITSHKLHHQALPQVMPHPATLSFWNLYYVDGDYLQAGIAWAKQDEVMAPLLEQLYDEPDQRDYGLAAAGILLAAVSLTRDEIMSEPDKSWSDAYQHFNITHAHQALPNT